MRLYSEYDVGSDGSRVLATNWPRNHGGRSFALDTALKLNSAVCSAVRWLRNVEELPMLVIDVGSPRG